MQQPPAPVTSALRRGLPLIIGVGLGLLYGWLRGSLFVLRDRMHGYGWHDYINDAYMIRHRIDLGYNNFRDPLHAAATGALGELMGSYANAAVLISSASLSAMVVGAALLGSALAGPWAGGLAAAAVTTVANQADAAQWANAYPMLGGLSGLCLGLGAWLPRKPSVPLALATALTGAAAVATDLRALILVLPALALGVFGLPAARGWIRRAAILLCLLAAIPVGRQVRTALWLPGVPDPTWSQRADFQRPVITGWIQRGNDPALLSACPGARAPEAREALGSPCGQALVRHNLERELGDTAPWGPGPTLLLLPLVLLPGRRGLKGSLGSVLALGGPLAGALLLAATMPVPARYAVEFATPFAAFLPVALARGLSTFLPKAALRPLLPLALIAAGAWGWWADPGQRRAQTSDERSPRESLEQAALALILDRVGPDDSYMDCTTIGVSGALLPRLTHPFPPLLQIQRGRERCAQWIAGAAEAQEVRWVSITPERTSGISERGPDAATTMRKLEALIATQPDWKLRAELQGFALYRHAPTL